MAVDEHRHVAASHLGVVRKAGDGAGRQREQLLEIAGGERNLGDLGFGDDASRAGSVGLDQRCFGGDLNAFRDTGHGELDIDAGGLRNLHVNTRKRGGLEAGSGDGQPVNTGRNHGNAKLAIVSAGGFAFLTIRTFEHHLGGRH